MTDFGDTEAILTAAPGGGAVGGTTVAWGVARLGRRRILWVRAEGCLDGQRAQDKNDESRGLHSFLQVNQGLVFSEQKVVSR